MWLWLPTLEAAIMDGLFVVVVSDASSRNHSPNQTPCYINRARAICIASFSRQTKHPDQWPIPINTGS